MERSLRILRQLQRQGREAFESDEVVQDRVDRNAQLLAQGCADIALHILAGTGTAAPETYAEALEDLGTVGIIDPAIATRLAAAVRLRNVLVHAYLEVDHGRLYDELGWIEDAGEFASAIEGWLSRQGAPHA